MRYLAFLVRKGPINTALFPPCPGLVHTDETSRPKVELWPRPNFSPCGLGGEKLQRLGEFTLSTCKRLLYVFLPQNLDTDFLALFVQLACVRRHLDGCFERLFSMLVGILKVHGYLVV